MNRYQRLLLLTIASTFLSGCTIYAKPARQPVVTLAHDAPNVVIVHSKPVKSRVCQQHGKHWHCQK
ncbi:MAG: hypothetical protein LPK11_08425 [Chromatiaceae bacterium]|nr:hypothetical protein [Chromatiaceae bacterium]